MLGSSGDPTRLLRFYRSTTVLFGGILLLLALLGWQDDTAVEARKIVLLDALGDPAVTLEAGQSAGQGALIVRDRDGNEIIRLGTPLARLIGD